MGGWLFYWEKEMVEHVAIADGDRHEVKHADSASSGQVLKSIGSGQTAFSFPTYAELQGKPTAVGYQQVLLAQSTAASQQPTALATALTVEFGPAQSNTNVSLSNTGVLTFNVSGQYAITLYLRFGRTTASGDAYLYSRLLVNGSQVLNSNALRLGSQDIVVPFSTTVMLDAVAGNTVSLQIMRDSAGANNGGLFQLTPSLSGWAAAPTATLVVYKMGGLQ